MFKAVKVHNHETPASTVEAAFNRIGSPFTAKELEKALIEAGVPVVVPEKTNSFRRTPCAMRVADRTIQRLRKAEKIEFNEDRQWVKKI